MGVNIMDAANTIADTKIGYFQNLEVQLGSSIAGRYTAMNPIQGKMIEPYQDYLSSIGKPTAMRGSQLTYSTVVTCESFGRRRKFKNDIAKPAPLG
eukprot:COSAG02_NODE_22747_length_741_cov_1.211838_2_plen_95_part_01